jgi:hypothetical protein
MPEPTPRMNLYLLTQTDNRSYDTFDACVVAAPDEDTARSIHPRGSIKADLERDCWVWLTNRYYESRDWARKPSTVTVRLLGVAEEGYEPSVICSSFNAG